MRTLLEELSVQAKKWNERRHQSEMGYPRLRAEIESFIESHGHLSAEQKEKLRAKLLPPNDKPCPPVSKTGWTREELEAQKAYLQSSVRRLEKIIEDKKSAIQSVYEELATMEDTK